MRASASSITVTSNPADSPLTAATAVSPCSASPSQPAIPRRHQRLPRTDRRNLALHQQEHVIVGMKTVFVADGGLESADDAADLAIRVRGGRTPPRPGRRGPGAVVTAREGGEDDRTAKLAPDPEDVFQLAGTFNGDLRAADETGVMPGGARLEPTNTDGDPRPRSARTAAAPCPHRGRAHSGGRPGPSSAATPPTSPDGPPT